MADSVSKPPKNPSLKRLVEEKRRWHYPSNPVSADAGFLGWHERGYLPHFDAPNVTQFVTFMLHDSFPVTRRPEWETVLKESDVSVRRRKLEAWLDRGHGGCWMLRKDVASVVEEILLAGDGKNFQLEAWVIMPNHVHLVVNVWDVPLSKLLNSWKGKSARAVNRILKRNGPFWGREYFDTLIRNDEHFGRAVRYIENNPVKAGFVTDTMNWPWGSAKASGKVRASAAA